MTASLIHASGVRRYAYLKKVICNPCLGGSAQGPGEGGKQGVQGFEKGIRWMIFRLEYPLMMQSSLCDPPPVNRTLAGRGKKNPQNDPEDL